ncbi:DUF1853 family protein [Paraburkholderia ginsengisoli]|uniref:DUF1853 family protein n=1 Tax=Paraburkholderia ginsengisoli TaxID=311231 RepID=A0A7T4T966_9BURK|nr:DUF1853 family protein [Paraburkholderia ginsengisoli]QQC64414.1 DUF1853 family protein [Paraburkholderia ginsengisoli]
MAADGPAAARVAAAPGQYAALLDTLLGALRDPAVRDLAWLLLSPDLLRPQPPMGALANPFDTPQELQASIEWLRALDAAPEPLQRELAAARITRLGRYAERLLGWFLQHGPAARLVAAGVPLRRAGVTLGECDFLVQSRQGARLHWELAVKCYLHAGAERGQEAAQTGSRLADYVGPNLKDRFDLKLAHLLNHQLPLSARDEFASVGHAGPWTPQMFVKGWLFYRHGERPADPVELDPAHGRGWWVTRSDWPAFAAAHAQKWRRLPRLEWLAPRRVECADEQADEQAGRQAARSLWVDAQTLAAQISTVHGPAMVVAFIEDEAGDSIERSRGFIVPDEWPEQARSYVGQRK